jgi:hypothetical protein
MNLAEKYCERFDTSSFLQLLPPDIGIGALSNYFTVVLENLTSHKRTLQVTFPVVIPHYDMTFFIFRRSCTNYYERERSIYELMVVMS